MIKPSPEYFERFYHPLIGDSERLEAFQERLAARINVCDSPNQDPYARLGAGLASEVQLATQHMAPYGGLQDVIWQASVTANGTFGTQLTVAALRTVGDIYVAQAEAPQTVESVTKSTKRALRYVYGLAFSGKVIGSFNLEAGRMGVNPRNPFRVAQAMHAAAKRPREANATSSFSTRTFVAESDASGQLDIRPRYRRLGKVADRQCPAAFAKVEVGGRMRPGLWTLMQTISSVAIAEIYPRQFEITESS